MKIYAHLFAAAGACLILFACGRSPHHRFSLSESTMMAEFEGMNLNDYCHKKGTPAGNSTQATQNLALSQKEPELSWKEKIIRYFSGSNDAKKPEKTEENAKNTEPHISQDFENLKHFSNGWQGESATAMGGGCVFRPIKEAWAAITRYDEFIWGNTQYTKTAPGSNPQTALFDDVSYIAIDPQGRANPSFRMIWAHYLEKGDLNHPTQVLIGYQLEHSDAPFGIKAFSQLEGSILLTELSPNVTGVLMTHKMITGDQSPPSDSQGMEENLMTALASSHPDWHHLETAKAATPTSKASGTKIGIPAHTPAVTQPKNPSPQDTNYQWIAPDDWKWVIWP